MPQATGAACVLDLAGVVREILHDDLGLLPPERAGRPFAGALDEAHRRQLAIVPPTRRMSSSKRARP